MISIKKEFRLLALACGLALMFSTAALAQDNGATPNSSAGSRSVANGQKMSITGNVTRRDADSFSVKDANGTETVVKLTDHTTVKTEGGFLRGGKNYSVTNILRG
ncbi:MAG TPA: hypothetical protein VGO91_19500, partial [Pyrinomonadaceae bacterium]|nr:hypothetical protein [Pyrinomonadaceae bacterium]